MIDDPAGTALREHLDDVLSGVRPHPFLLENVRAEHDRRSRRRAMAMASGSALTAATATAVVLWGSTIDLGHHVGGHHTQPTPLASPSYPPAQPDERWFAEPYALPRPSGEIARIALPSEDNDPANSRRTLLVWYNAPKDTFCEHDIVQSPDYPEGSERAGGGSSGGCSAIPPSNPRHTGLVSGSENCKGDSWLYWFGVVGADAPTVEVRGVGGPDPQVTTQQLDGAPTPFFVVIDATAPVLEFRYLAADGHLVREQLERHSLARGGATYCGNPTPTPTPSG